MRASVVWRQVVQQARRAACHASLLQLAQLGQLANQGFDLLLLANHYPVELVEQVFCKAGLDLQRCQSLA